MNSNRIISGDNGDALLSVFLISLIPVIELVSWQVDSSIQIAFNNVLFVDNSPTTVGEKLIKKITNRRETFRCITPFIPFPLHDI
tara:strand:- start:5394 stop:5648 length:255 start_codon:yes stop_codon:yes gene_type:complete